MKYKISIVSYSNTIPFIYGLSISQMNNMISYSLDYPSLCAKKLLDNNVDIGLSPVALLSNHNLHVISDYCIGSDGKVDTVCLFSDVPIERVKSIYLDYQSITSNALLKLLCKEYWDIKPDYINSNSGFEGDISGNVSRLIIGDRAFSLRNRFEYIYDLSEIWKRHTNLPFVFACWMSNKKIEKDFLKEFNMALHIGVNNIDLSIQKESEDNSILLDYLNNKISYSLDNDKKKGMSLFLEKVCKYNLF